MWRGYYDDTGISSIFFSIATSNESQLANKSFDNRLHSPPPENEAGGPRAVGAGFPNQP